jgi:DNA-binding CsgD family transcriptional regulator
MNHPVNLTLSHSSEFFAMSEFLFLLYQIEPGTRFGDHLDGCFEKAFPDRKVSCRQIDSGEFPDQSMAEEDDQVFNALVPHIRNAFQIATRISPRENQKREISRFDLTPREKEVALWMKEGKRDKEIAIILGISSRTVEKHVHQILEKLQVENRSSAIAVLSENRLSWKVRHSPSEGTKPKEKGIQGLTEKRSRCLGGYRSTGEQNQSLLPSLSRKLPT